MLEKAKKGDVKINEIMKELAKEKDLKDKMKDVASFVSKTVKMLCRIPEDRRERMLKIGVKDEKRIIEDAVDFLRERFDAQIEVYSEEDAKRYDPKQRAANAAPYQPAIYLE